MHDQDDVTPTNVLPAEKPAEKVEGAPAQQAGFDVLYARCTCGRRVGVYESGQVRCLCGRLLEVVRKE